MIKVIYKKLGIDRAIGLAYKKAKVVVLDDRIHGKEWLITLIHEIMHIQCPGWSEEEVDKKSTEMGNVVWKELMARFEKI